MKESPLTKSIKVLLFIFLLGMVLYKIKPFAVPLAFAGLLSMLLLPVCRKLEGWGLGKGLSVAAALLLLLVIVGIIAGILTWQISDLSKNADNLEKNVNEKIGQIREYATNVFGLSRQKQEEIIQKQQQSSGNKVNGIVMGALGSVGAALTNILLVLVYMFLFLYFRDHLKKFVLQLVPKAEQAHARVVMEDSRRVAQKYLTGMALMIVSLWVMYGIGFSIVGVKHAIFFAILCGLLEIIPFVGNLAGNLLTIFMTVAQGGSMTQIIGIVVTYAIVQFIQSYLIEPLVVGKEVSIHPMFTIIGIVAGEFIWGIPGMILAIPVIGIVKIVCDHIEPLKPYGFLIGSEEGEGGGGMMDKIKGLFKKG